MSRYENVLLVAVIVCIVLLVAEGDFVVEYDEQCVQDIGKEVYCVK